MDFSSIITPSYVIDVNKLITNLEILLGVQEKAGCRILLAQKGFSMYSLYPLIGRYLAGTAASSLFEARLGHEEMGKEVHIYSPAYNEKDFDEIVDYTSHIIFNSLNEFIKYKDRLKGRQAGIRINPGYSEVKTEIYNPCARYSRLGSVDIKPQDLLGIDGLHFHTMCEQNSDTLIRTIEVIEKKYGECLRKVKWLNMGGGHHITREDYDVEALISCIRYIKDKYGVEVYLEPGEAIALNTGYLVASVLDIINNEIDIAVLDTSAACHMPDVIEMPYRPNIIGSGREGEYKYNYRLAGATCLAGDIIGDYSFTKPLKEKDKLIFTDMAHYTMVKNNTFNGINLPSIMLITSEGELKTIKSFGYEDFKSRL